MYWTTITTNGNFAIMPPKTRGEGVNTYASSESGSDEAGTVVLDTTSGSGAVTIGFFDGPSSSASFHLFDAGLMSGLDTYVRHGKGTRLGVNVTGVAGTLRVGYAGASR